MDVVKVVLQDPLWCLRKPKYINNLFCNGIKMTKRDTSGIEKQVAHLREYNPEEHGYRPVETFRD
jgi:hypothetical protein